MTNCLLLNNITYEHIINLSKNFGVEIIFFTYKIFSIGGTGTKLMYCL